MEESSRGRPTMEMQMQPMNSPDGQNSSRHANVVLADMIMQMRNPHMRVEQINGQRCYGPPTHHVGPPPPKGSEVYVGNIPNNIFELELTRIFEKVGKIYEIRILMNFSGLNRGYGYVRFYTPEEADKALSVLHKYEIRKNIHLLVMKSVDNRRLYISNIPLEKTGQEIFDEMVRVGVSGISRVIATSGGGCGGAVFIDFENHTTAALTRSSVMVGRTQLWGNHVHVEWALSEPETNVLFVRNLAETTTGEQLEELFNDNSGGGVRRLCKMESTAYISFETPAQAEQARDALDNMTLDESRIDVLAVHGSEDMMPMPLGIPSPSLTPETKLTHLTISGWSDNGQQFFGHGFPQPDFQYGIIPSQEIEPTELLAVPISDGIPMVPVTFSDPMAFPNPGFSFPTFGFPSFLPFVPGMMSMSSNPSGQTNDNKKSTEEEESDDLIDWEQVEE